MPSSPGDVLAAYGAFLIRRRQLFSAAAENSGSSGIGVRDLTELLDSACVLLRQLDGFPENDSPPLLPSEVGLTLNVAVPALLVKVGYRTPPPPTFEQLLGLTMLATHPLGTAHHERVRFAEWADELDTIKSRIVSPAAGGPPRTWRDNLLGVRRVANKLLPFLTAATAVACAPLLFPAAVAGVMTAVGSSLAGLFLPPAEDLRDLYGHEPIMDVPGDELRAWAAERALAVADSCRQSDSAYSQQLAAWASGAARYHVSVLRGNIPPSEARAPAAHAWPRHGRRVRRVVDLTPGQPADSEGPNANAAPAPAPAQAERVVRRRPRPSGPGAPGSTGSL